MHVLALPDGRLGLIDYGAVMRLTEEQRTCVAKLFVAIADEDDAEFELSVLDVLRGLQRARDIGWIDYRTVSVEDHSQMLRPEHGDMSWLLPGKALALASPWADRHDQDGLPVCTPALLGPYFRSHRVSLVVQCNHPDREEEGERRRLLCYNPRNFEDIGIRHVHLPFEDGGCPSVDIVLKFLELVQALGNGVACAVHCRSGLGRTATVIGAYAMLHCGFSARAFIGWARVVRPGTVHGSQQQYLVNLESHIKLGSPRPLVTLDQRERLRLLPRREARPSSSSGECGSQRAPPARAALPNVSEHSNRQSGCR